MQEKHSQNRDARMRLIEIAWASARQPQRRHRQSHSEEALLPKVRLMNGLLMAPLAEPAKTRLDHNPSRQARDTAKAAHLSGAKRPVRSVHGNIPSLREKAV